MYSWNESDRPNVRREALFYFGGICRSFFLSINARQLNSGGKNNTKLESLLSCYVFIHLGALLCITLHIISKCHFLYEIQIFCV